MAVSYTVPNTFSALTVAESAKVNANENYTKAVFDGLEAGTKTLAMLKMDSTPSTSTEVATKAYVDRYATWRRPNLVFGSVTTVSVESGLNGTSGEITILFPDGSVRTETSTTRTTFDITRTAVLTDSGAQSGLRSGTSEQSNTIYALYAVKVSDSSTKWCTVGTDIHPTQTNYASLNSNFGTNSWVYLGYILNGAAATQSTDICDFVQCGNVTLLKNIQTTANINGSGRDKFGVRMATTAGASTLTSSPSAGITVGTNYPETAKHLFWTFVAGTGTSQVYYGDSTVSTTAGVVIGTLASIGGVEMSSTAILPASSGAGISNASASSPAMSLLMHGWVDGALGFGSNPLL